MQRQEMRKIGTFPKMKLLASAIISFSLATPNLYANESTSQMTNTTTVYKVVNPDGSISFSDQAQTNAVRLEVPPVATVPALKIESTTSSQVSAAAEAYYQSITILDPKNNSAFHSGSGEVNVSTKIEPPLRPDDLVRYSLNGTELKTVASAGVQLSNINRGTHIITVEVIDQNNQVLLTSSSQFTLHRPIAKPFSIR